MHISASLLGLRISAESHDASCFVADVFTAVHLLFIAVFAAQSVHARRSKRTSGCAGKTSALYQVVRLCCFLMLASHILKLSLTALQWRRNAAAACSFLLSVAHSCAELVSWALLLAAVLMFKRSSCAVLPWTVRAWWICSFLESAICVAVTSKDIAQIADLIMLTCSTCLLFVSIRGRTGVAAAEDAAAAEPLLRSPPPPPPPEHCPYGKASVLQLVTFSWMNRLFAAGAKKALDKDDVPDIGPRDTAASLSASLNDILSGVKETDGLTTAAIYKSAFLFLRRKAAANAAFAVLSATASYVGPFFISDFVEFLGSGRRHGLAKGYALALAFLAAKVVETVAQRQWIFGARQLGMRLRAALISHIYQKGLRLSCGARQKHTSGEIINYMSVDIQRITDCIWYVNYTWMLPIQLSLATVVLHRSLSGISALAALAATFAVMLCNVPLSRMQKRLQSSIMRAKDSRMKATSEVLRSMRILKLQAWDMQYLLKLEQLRRAEYSWLWKSVRLGAFMAFIFWGSPAFISSATFGVCILTRIPLTAGSVLSVLATFRMLQDAIFSLPDMLSVFIQGKVSADRVAHYLQEEELRSDAVTIVGVGEADNAVEINGGVFSWDAESASPTLRDVDLKVKRGLKVAICGMVGSGKSSLLSCIMGEMPKLAGAVRVGGTTAYVPQTPWILSGNIRDNILFGNAYEEEKYDRIVRACALARDMELFASGDMTEIGERGINMSGGQKQRIQIARSVYQDADLYLFDDPFSAVDAHTGSQLFKDCLMGMLSEKTVLYVTHQVEFLPSADLILVMQNGKIAQAGRFDDLLRDNVEFEVIVGAHSQALESVLSAKTTSRESQTSNTISESDDQEEEEQQQLQSIASQESESDLCQSNRAQRGRLTQEEEREKGGIGKKVYWEYLTAVHGGALVPLTILAQVSFQTLQILSNYWMAWAAPPTAAAEQTVPIGSLVSVYVALSMGSAVCVFGRAMLVATVGLKTSEKFFRNMLHCILRAPMAFFDATPTGRILNRASNDQSVLDLDLANKLGWCAFSTIQLLGTITVMSQVAWQVFAIFIPVTVICIMYQRYYTPTARELARLSEVQRAPILHHFAESLAGAPTIRAYGQKERFSSTNAALADNHSRPWFHNVSAMEWLSFRLNMLSNLVFAFSLALLVTLPEGFINPSIAGLAVTYALNLNSQLASIIWNICNTENKMVSVERLMQYSRIPAEAPLVIEAMRPPEKWPESGTLHIRSLEVRYAEHLPSVLRGVSCSIPGRKKVGIVGRTGSGKSTLIQALFRLVEPRGGMIEIDGVDICRIGLHDLRSRLSIIPQDPTMFEGSVRANLDPLNEYSDESIWEILDKCQLGGIIRRSERKLDSPVVENGENWSVGQRQLFCLGRVLLKRSSILVLDEATASVDTATDGIIQETIRREFDGCTVLTIAHRIHTVIDSDLILVMSEGRVIEYDAPSRLLEREDSAFSMLIKEYSRRSKSLSS